MPFNHKCIVMIYYYFNFTSTQIQNLLQNEIDFILKCWNRTEKKEIAIERDKNTITYNS